MDTKLIVGIIVAVVIILAIIVTIVSIRRARHRHDVDGTGAAANIGQGASGGPDTADAAGNEPGPRLQPVSAEVLDPAAAVVDDLAKSGEHISSELQRPESSASRLLRLRSRLAKSANPFGKVLFNILTKDNLTESDWEDVEDTLLLADVGAEASSQLVDELRSDARVTGQKNPAEVRDLLRGKLLELVDIGQDRSLAASREHADKPSVIMMVGVNGTGKTTTAGKLARLFVAESKSVVMGAADTFRAAAADQLETWGNKVSVPVVRSDKDG
ncbi:signal recognition particle receptor subunit alpha, partial [Bifidobacterium mongoliense]